MPLSLFSIRAGFRSHVLLPLAAKKRIRLSCRIDPATPNHLIDARAQGGAIFRFFVRLPLSDEVATSAALPAIQARPPLQGALHLQTNVLLAEDNLVNQKVAARMLQKLGFAADIAANGQEVLEKLSQRPYDLVLMDMQMPDMDGLEASRRIRALNSAQPTIIALSANVHREALNECLAAGMDGFLAKPITLEALQEALSKAVTTKIDQP